jgi:hypothetical protein
MGENSKGKGWKNNGNYEMIPINHKIPCMTILMNYEPMYITDLNL